jgi:small-conductance mechanosensitive channel
MAGYQLNRFLGTLYIICGFVLVFLVLWKLILWALLVLLGLFLISYGFKMQGYPTSRFVFMAQQWKSRFRP